MGLWHVCEVSFFNEVVYSGLSVGDCGCPVLCAADKRCAAACATQRAPAHVCAFMKELH